MSQSVTIWFKEPHLKTLTVEFETYEYTTSELNFHSKNQEKTLASVSRSSIAAVIWH